MTTTELLLAVFGIALGGFLKGATGAGAPVVGVPILALAVGVPQAVAVFSVINMVSNAWQASAYRSELSADGFVWRFALFGGIGVAIGSLLLAWLPTEALMAGLALIVFAYIALRLTRPGWSIGSETGLRLAIPAGFAGGLMQGAGGISAPVSVTFLNAMRLERRRFIATISVFFLVMSAFQVPSLIALGILDLRGFGYGLLACVPLFGSMPLGELAARHLSKEAFDRLILALLTLVALKLVYDAVT